MIFYSKNVVCCISWNAISALLFKQKVVIISIIYSTNDNDKYHKNMNAKVKGYSFNISIFNEVNIHVCDCCSKHFTIHDIFLCMFRENQFFKPNLVVVERSIKRNKKCLILFFVNVFIVCVKKTTLSSLHKMPEGTLEQYVVQRRCYHYKPT